MSRAFIIAKRELSSYFYSPVAYVAMTLFLFAAGWFFWDDFTPGQPVEIPSGRGEAFRIEDPSGEEKLFILLTRAPESDLDKLVASLRQDGSRSHS